MRRNAGFTLIELLVVIAIIAILAAILFPVIMTAKERGRMTKCLHNLKNLSMAFRLYADDNGGRLPSTFYGWQAPDWCGVQLGYSDRVYLEQGSIWRYTNKSKGIYTCPSDAHIAPTNVTPKTRKYPISYAMNWELGATKSVPECHGRDRVAIDAVRRPSRVLLLIHEGRENIDDGCFYWFAGNPDIANKPSRIHYGGTTASYLDGHAKWLSYDAFIKERDDGSWDPDPVLP